MVVLRIILLFILVCSGLYVNSLYQVFPRSAGIRCKETIRPTRFYKFGITRTAQGDVTLYLNGGICVAGKPGVSENLALDPKDVVFFHDDGSENPSGEVGPPKLRSSDLGRLVLGSFPGRSTHGMLRRCGGSLCGIRPNRRQKWRLPRTVFLPPRTSHAQTRYHLLRLMSGTVSRRRGITIKRGLVTGEAG